jgi:hypothetical protein
MRSAYCSPLRPRSGHRSNCVRTLGFPGRKWTAWPDYRKPMCNRCVRPGGRFMVITKDQFKAANARGAAAVARGPIAQAARYDSRRWLIVITLEGGCEFAFPVAWPKDWQMPPLKVEKNQDQRERARPALAAAGCRSLCAGPHRRSLRFTSVDATDWQTRGGKPAVRSRRRPPVRTVNAAAVPK